MVRLKKTEEQAMDNEFDESQACIKTACRHKYIEFRTDTTKMFLQDASFSEKLFAKPQTGTSPQ